MTTETMNIRSAQDEKKLLDKKIERAFENFRPLVGYSQTAPYIGSMLPEDFSKKVVEDYQSLNDLITRREAIVKAIMNANIDVKVKVRKFTGFNSLSKKATELTDEDYETITIANAINRKGYFEKVIIAGIKRIDRDVQNNITNFKDIINKSQQAVERTINERFSNQTNASQEARDKAYETEKARFATHLIDPIKAESLVINVMDGIEEYVKHLNGALSHITETTEITIEY